MTGPWCVFRWRKGGLQMGYKHVRCYLECYWLGESSLER